MYRNTTAADLATAMRMVEDLSKKPVIIEWVEFKRQENDAVNIQVTYRSKQDEAA